MIRNAGSTILNSVFQVAVLVGAASVQGEDQVNVAHEVTSSFVEVDDGRLYYEECGKGPLVVLIHGFTLDCRMWESEFRELPRQFRVVRYDLRGHGKSSGVSRPFSHVSDLRGLLERVGAEKVHLIGLSLGGEIAADFAIVYPERVDSVVLIDPYYPLPKPSAFAERLKRYIDCAKSDGLEKGLSEWLEDPLFESTRAKESVKARLTEIVIGGQGAQRNGALFLNAGRQQKPSGRKGKSPRDIRCKVLLLVGEHDIQRFHEIAEMFERLVPQIRRVMVPDAGHMANMENPEFVRKYVLAFLGDEVFRQTPQS